MDYVWLVYYVESLTTQLSMFVLRDPCWLTYFLEISIADVLGRIVNTLYISMVKNLYLILVSCGVKKSHYLPATLLFGGDKFHLYSEELPVPYFCKLIWSVLRTVELQLSLCCNDLFIFIPN